MKRISSHYLLTPQGLLPDRIVTVGDDGVITGISETSMLDREAGVQFYPGIIVPGFVNAHCHLELSYMRGAISPGGGFVGFAKGMRENRNRFTMEERLAAADFRDAKMWAEGISAVGDICNGTSTFDIKQRSRIRYFSFAELFGLDADPSVAQNVRDKAVASGLAAEITPHATYSLNRTAFAAAADGDLNRPLSIHFFESDSETKLFRHEGDMWEWYESNGTLPDFTDYGGPAERLAAQVPRDRPVLLVHDCAVTQRDIDIVMGHFTAPVTWVICPGSNLYISGSEPPVELLRKNGLTIAVGTDSLASNTTLSMVHELGFLKGIPLAEMLGWATLNGARALGMDSELGSVEVGKSPGIALLSGVDFETMSLTANAKAERII